MTEDDARVRVLRHALATLAYRSSKVLRDATPEFAGFCAGESVRTPAAVVSHMADLLAWSASVCGGEQVLRETAGEPLAAATRRCFQALWGRDSLIEAAAPASIPCERLLPGPIADALSHTGQLAMLRRLADQPVLPRLRPEGRCACACLGGPADGRLLLNALPSVGQTVHYRGAAA